MKVEHEINFDFSPKKLNNSNSDNRSFNNKSVLRKQKELIYGLGVIAAFSIAAYIFQSPDVPMPKTDSYIISTQARQMLGVTFSNLTPDNYKEQLFNLEGKNLYTSNGYNEMLENIGHKEKLVEHFNDGDTLTVQSQFKNSPPWIKNALFSKGKAAWDVAVPVSFIWTTPDHQVTTHNEIAIISFIQGNDETNPDMIKGFKLENTQKNWK